MSGQIIMQNKQIVIIGSNSVHTLRYLRAVCNHTSAKVIFITNNIHNITLPQNVISYSVNFGLRNFRAKTQIASILRKYINCIVHIHQANSYAYHSIRAVRSLKKLQAKIILTTWGSDVLILPHKNPIFKRMVKYNLKNADVITSDSLYMSAQIRYLLDSEKDLRTINFGMQYFPKELNLTQKEDVILSNRLHKSLYRVDKIITNFASFIATNQTYANYKLVVAGSGELTHDLIKLAKNIGLNEKQIIFVGMLGYKELQEWYKKAKLFISVPASDATSISVLEAMGYGCYPILSNIPANLEWVLDEINGKICQSVDVLDHDINYAISVVENRDKFQEVTLFNHTLISKKAVFENNMAKFFQLYE